MERRVLLGDLKEQIASCMKRRAIEKASSGICEIDASSDTPDSFDDDMLKRLYGLR